MGWPVSHSLSPKLHGFWLEEHKINGLYTALPVREEDFSKTLRALGDMGYAGANVTVPHKEAAFKTVDETDEAAQKTGAVNTVIIKKDGSLEGRNTDVFGFLENMDDRAHDWDREKGKCVVLGAGGAARAVCAGLLMRGFDNILVLNRTEERAVRLVEDLGPGLASASWSGRNKALEGAGVLVNTTTLGMKEAAPLDLDLAALILMAAILEDMIDLGFVFHIFVEVAFGFFEVALAC